MDLLKVKLTDLNVKHEIIVLDIYLHKNITYLSPEYFPFYAPFYAMF